MSGIAVRDLRHAFGGQAVLRGVTFTVPEGCFMALLGPSGAGKTTLFRCLTRLIRPDAGSMELAGHPMHRLRGRALAAARRDVGVVFQQFNLVRRRSALENAMSGHLASIPLWRVLLDRYTAADRAAALAALDRVGLSDQAAQRADSLSGGQQQRVAIARALVQNGRVLLADEPVASLDPDNAAAVMALMRDVARERSMTVLCSLHQPALAAAYADRVLDMRDGVIAEA